jgi:hypothetical protein
MDIIVDMIVDIVVFDEHAEQSSTDLLKQYVHYTRL